MASLTCQECGEGFEHARSNTRFCGRSCRQRANRKGSTAAPVATHDDSDVEPNADLALIATVTAALTVAGQLDTWQGQGALVLARDLAHSRYGAGAHASLMKELRAVMAEIAPAQVAAKSSPVEQIRGRGASRRTGPTVLRIVS